MDETKVALIVNGLSLATSVATEPSTVKVSSEILNAPPAPISPEEVNAILTGVPPSTDAVTSPAPLLVPTSKPISAVPFDSVCAVPAPLLNDASSGSLMVKVTSLFAAEP
ncbi:MAG: hypothetical protein KKA56_06425, partial [Gammaproteobacteria bacterium]|nr:hypothetical protein [Gammaproteobacteria bacterium]